MKRVALAAAVFFLCLGSLTGQVGPKEMRVDIRGTIKTVMVRKGDAKILAVVLVEGVPDKGTSYDKASVKITKTTKLVRIGAKDRRAATVEDLKVGARVEMIFVGPVAESYPVQATAGEVRILEKE